MVPVAEWIEANWSRDLTLGRWWDLLFDAGLAFPTWPIGLGGSAAAGAEARVVAATLAAAGVIAAPEGPGPNMGGPTLLDHGTPEQQRRFVEPLGRGRTQWCQLFSEPGAGSDLASVSTRAVRDGDVFVIDGQKVWSSRAATSDWGMLLCRTDRDAPKHRGLSYLMIDLHQPGVEIRPLVQMNGAAEFSEVFLTEPVVPVDDVIGPLGSGWDVARTTLRHERASTSAGPARGAVVAQAGRSGSGLDRTVGEIVDEWHAAGGAPERQAALLGSRAMVDLARRHTRAEDPVVRDRLARFHADAQVYRWNGKRLGDLSRAEVSTPLDGPLLKLDLAMLAHESRDLSLDIVGPAGMLAGPDSPEGGSIVRTALTAFVPSLGGGTNEIQRNIVGERTLGLPREPEEQR